MIETGNDKTASSEDQDGTPLSYGKALSGVVKKLHNQILLFILGAAIIFLAAAALGLAQLRMLTVPLLILFILGTIGWLFQQAHKLRADRGGNVNIGFGSRLNKVKINTGVSRASKSSRAAKGGDVSVKPLVKADDVEIEAGVKNASNEN